MNKSAKSAVATAALVALACVAQMQEGLHAPPRAPIAHSPGAATVSPITKRVDFAAPPLIKSGYNVSDGAVQKGNLSYDAAAQALKMSYPAVSGPDAGFFEANFGNATATDFPVQFGPGAPFGDEFYVQWQQKFDPNYLGDKSVSGGNGHKQIIITTGDNKATDGKTAYSAHCMESQIVVQDIGYGNMPRVYHSCGYWDGQGGRLYEPLAPVVDGEVLYQNAVGCRFRDAARPPYGRGDKRKCTQYYANEWMTFQLHVKAASDYSNPAEYGGAVTDNPNDRNYHHNAVVELWAAREKQPSQLVVSLTDYDLAVHVVDEDGNSQFNQRKYPPDGYPGWLRDHHRVARYGKAVLTSLDYGRNSNWTDPTGGGSTWYDNLTISTRRLPDPGVTAPNAPDSLTVSTNGKDNALSWRDNSDVPGATPAQQFEIQRCAEWRHKCDLTQLWSTLATEAVSASCSGETCTFVDRGQGDKTRAYRVRAINQGGKSAFSNAADNLPGWLQDVSAKANDAASVTITWRLGNPPPATGIRVQRCGGTYLACLKGAWVDVAGCTAVPPSSTTCSDTRVASGATFTYRAQAFSPSGMQRAWSGKTTSNVWSGMSRIAQVTISAGANPATAAGNSGPEANAKAVAPPRQLAATMGTAAVRSGANLPATAADTPARNSAADVLKSKRADGVFGLGWNVLRDKRGRPITLHTADYEGRPVRQPSNYSIAPRNAAGVAAAGKCFSEQQGYPPAPSPTCNNYNQDGYRAVIQQWSGGVLRASTNELVVFGGGHSGYGGNEIYALKFGPGPAVFRRMRDAEVGTGQCSNWNGHTWSPSTPGYPGVCFQGLPPVDAAGKTVTVGQSTVCFDNPTPTSPNSRHTYGGLAYIPAGKGGLPYGHDGMLLHGGSAGCSNGGFPNDYWLYDFVADSWTQKVKAKDTITGSDVLWVDSLPNGTAYDKVVVLDSNSIWSYDLTGGGAAAKTLLSSISLGSHMHAAYDKRRGVVVAAGKYDSSTFLVSEVDLTTKPVKVARFYNPDGCTVSTWGTRNENAGGVAYDERTQEVVFWPNAGRAIYPWEPVTHTCKAPEVYDTTDGPRATVGEVHGTFGRFQYVPGKDYYILLSDYDVPPYVLCRKPEGCAP